MSNLLPGLGDLFKDVIDGITMIGEQVASHQPRRASRNLRSNRRRRSSNNTRNNNVSNLEFVESGIAHVGSVGNGSSNTSRQKSILVELANGIPEAKVNQVVFKFSQTYSGYSDQFEFEGELINEESFILKVTRMDAPHGWGQDLKVSWNLYFDPSAKSTESTSLVKTTNDETAELLVEMGYPRLSALDALDHFSSAPGADPGHVMDAGIEWLSSNNVTPSLSPARLVRTKSFDLLCHWREVATFESGYSPLPQFASVQHRIIVKPEFMNSTALGKIGTALLQYAVKRRLESNRESFKLTLDSLIQTVYKIGLSGVQHQVVEVSGYDNENRCILENCMRLYSDLGFGDHKKFLHFALDFLNLVHTQDSNNERLQETKLLFALMVRGGDECIARKRKVVGTILHKVFDSDNLTKLKTFAPDAFVTESDDNLDSMDGETKIIHELKRDLVKLCADYIDVLKDRAFQSVFLEPSHMMLQLGGNRVADGDVDVHGSSTYAAILTATLGIQVSHRPYLSDQVKGVCDFLYAAKASRVVGPLEAVHKIWDPQYAGKSWRAVVGHSTVSQLARFYVTAPLYFVLPQQDASVAILVNKLCNKCLPQEQLSHLLEYLDAFASHFTEEALLEKLVSNLCVDNSAVALNALETFFAKHVLPQAYIQGGVLVPVGGEPSTVREWLYDVEHEYAFQPERARFLFEQIGILKNRSV